MDASNTIGDVAKDAPAHAAETAQMRHFLFDILFILLQENSPWCACFPYLSPLMIPGKARFPTSRSRKSRRRGGYLWEVEQTLAEHPHVKPLVLIASLLVSSLDIAEVLICVAETGEEEARIDLPGGYDLIALATHGRSSLAHRGIGSITERVLHTTRVAAPDYSPSTDAAALPPLKSRESCESKAARPVEQIHFKAC